MPAEPRHAASSADRARAPKTSATPRAPCSARRPAAGTETAATATSVGRLGYGRTTGYQNSSAAARKQACSTTVPASFVSAEFVAARRVPEPGRRHVDRPGHERMRERAEERAAIAASAAAARPSTFAPARGRPRTSGNSGQPSQSSGGAIIISKQVLQHVDLQQAATRTARSARRARERSRRARRGRRRQSASVPAARDRGGAAAASRASRRRREPGATPTSHGSHGQERRNASNVGLMAVGTRSVDGCVRHARRQARASHRRAGGQLALGPQAHQEIDERVHLGRAHLLAVGGHVAAAGRAVADLVDELVARQAGADRREVGPAVGRRRRRARGSCGSSCTETRATPCSSTRRAALDDRARGSDRRSRRSFRATTARVTPS